MYRFADVLLPLPLNATYTYRIPEPMQLSVGERVIVPFGARKYYTAVVDRIHDEEPSGFEIKDIAEQLDTEPILLPVQQKLWRWIADYYMCSPGDVFKAALPSGMKLESETVLVCCEESPTPEEISQPKVQQVWNLLHEQKEMSLSLLQKRITSFPVLSVVRKMLDSGLLTVKEEVRSGYRPLTETMVTLSEPYRSEEALHQALDLVRRAEKQTQLLCAFLELSGWGRALEKNDPLLVKPVSRAVLQQYSGVNSSLVQTLVKRGILTLYAAEIGRLDRQSRDVQAAAQLSEPQETAYREILQAFQEKSVCLLHGVTSSGKTEVYIHLIQHYLEQGKQVLFLLPEIVLTTQLTERLRRVFGNRMGVYHSRFSDAERVEIWKKQLSAEGYDVIVGVRSSVFLPFRNLGLVIVDEEHEPSYKQQEPAPRYHARNVALVLASFYGAHTLLGTATPSFESYYHARNGKYALVNLHTRYAQVALPEIKVVDIKELSRKKLMKGVFSPVLLQAIGTALEAKEQVILFQNRRGFAPIVQCKECDWIPKCKNCDVSLTYHKRFDMLTCHYCGFSAPIPKSCPSCGSLVLKHKGLGTEKVEYEIHECFPEAKVARMDLDTTRTRKAYEQILMDFESGKTDILIGTQMVSKGLDFDRVRIVGILDADGMLNIPDFRSYERAFQMMAQVAGRAGRRGDRGIVFLQTRNPESPVVVQVVDHDYLAHYLWQMQERKLFHYPPFCHLIYVFLKYRQEEPLDRFAHQLAERLRQVFGSRVLGPDAPPVARVQSLYIRKIVLKVELSASHSKVRTVLQKVCQTALQESSCSSIQLYFDVDPL